MAPQCWLDGIDVSNVALEGSVKRRLNRPAEASIRIPMDFAIGGPGSRLKISLDGALAFHGFVLMCETDATEDMGYTVYNAQDPMELWKWRPARDFDGDFSDPDFMKIFHTGPDIMNEILHNSESAIDLGTGNPDNSTREGPLFIEYGTVEAGGSDLAGAPTNWPMTIAEIADLLTSTGELDIIMVPIDSGGNMAQVNLYNGDYGTNRTGSVVFQFATGQRNVRQVRVSEDMTNMVNKLWYYLGPRKTQQRWQTNITRDGLLNNPNTGDDEFLQTIQAISDRMDASWAQYGVRMEVQIHDSQETESAAKALFVRLWQVEAYLRAIPRTLVHITPIRGHAINTFGIGDLVSVQVGSVVRGGFSGAQRVYEYTVSWTEDGPLELSELVTSADQG